MSNKQKSFVSGSQKSKSRRRNGRSSASSRRTKGESRSSAHKLANDRAAFFEWIKKSSDEEVIKHAREVGYNNPTFPLNLRAIRFMIRTSERWLANVEENEAQAKAMKKALKDTMTPEEEVRIKEEAARIRAETTPIDWTSLSVEELDAMLADLESNLDSDSESDSDEDGL